jgi:DNA-binding CsgD family transcriptional regulator
MPNPRCQLHPAAPVRRYRTNGPNGPGVYPQCVPADGNAPHLLTWDDTPSKAEASKVEVCIADDVASLSLLSPSELGVLCAAANGFTSLESGRRLSKGVETVKTQRHQILMKLGARNITQAVCIATEQGFLVVDRGRMRAMLAV